jgi:hypothetical protein
MMSKGKSSGIRLKKTDLPIVVGMDARGDRNHDIAAWFGVNQGRIAEVKSGDYGSVVAAPASSLPPKGPPGIKGKELRAATGSIYGKLASLNSPDLAQILKTFQNALDQYDQDEV